MGQWRCHVQTVEYVEKEDALKAVLIVHVPIKGDEKLQSTKSWLCSRNVTEFHDMHKQLSSIASDLKSLCTSTVGGPNSLIKFGSRSQSIQAKTEKTRSLLQKYMDAVMSDGEYGF